MSALTDLFTSLANKIRSKLGTQATYTPSQAISAIDDVYDKGVTDTKVGTAVQSDVKSGKTFTNSSGVGLTGTFAAQEKTVTSSRSAQTVTPDSGKYLSKVTVNALAPTGTYTPTSRATNIDMGATSNYRYVTTTSVPNSNSGTYTYAANSTGGTIDMGATNTYRYVNATNVYNKGKADGETSFNLTRIASGGGSSVIVTLSAAYKYVIAIAVDNDTYRKCSYSGGGTVLVDNYVVNSTFATTIVKDATAGSTFTLQYNYVVYGLN